MPNNLELRGKSIHRSKVEKKFLPTGRKTAEKAIFWITPPTIGGMKKYYPVKITGNDALAGVTPQTTNFEMEFPSSSEDCKGRSIERRSGAGGKGCRSIRVIVYGKRIQVSLLTRYAAIAYRRECVVREMFRCGATAEEARKWVRCDAEDELFALVRKKIQNTCRANQVTLGQLLPIISRFEMLPGRRQITSRQKEAIKSGLRYMATWALVSRLQIAVRSKGRFPDDVLTAVPLEWLCPKTLNERVCANRLVARGTHQTAVRRTLLTHLSAVKGLLRPEFARHALAAGVIMPKKFLDLKLVRPKHVPTSGTRMIRLSDIASICKLIAEAVAGNVPGAWLLLAALYCPIKSNAWLGDLSKWLCEPQRVRLPTGTIFLPANVYLVLRGNYPFSSGSGIVTATILRREKEKIIKHLRALNIPGWDGKPLQQLSRLGRALLHKPCQNGPVVLKQLGLKSAGNIQYLKQEYGAEVFSLIGKLESELPNHLTKKAL